MSETERGKGKALIWGNKVVGARHGEKSSMAHPHCR